MINLPSVVQAYTSHVDEILFGIPSRPMLLQGCKRDTTILILAESILVYNPVVASILKHTRGDPWLAGFVSQTYVYWAERNLPPS